MHSIFHLNSRNGFFKYPEIQILYWKIRGLVLGVVTFGNYFGRTILKPFKNLGFRGTVRITCDINGFGPVIKCYYFL